MELWYSTVGMVVVWLDVQFRAVYKYLHLAAALLKSCQPLPCQKRSEPKWMDSAGGGGVPGKGSDSAGIENN